MRLLLGLLLLHASWHSTTAEFEFERLEDKAALLQFKAAEKILNNISHHSSSDAWLRSTATGMMPGLKWLSFVTSYLAKAFKSGDKKHEKMEKDIMDAMEHWQIPCSSCGDLETISVAKGVEFVLWLPDKDDRKELWPRTKADWKEWSNINPMAIISCNTDSHDQKKIHPELPTFARKLTFVAYQVWQWFLHLTRCVACSLCGLRAFETEVALDLEDDLELSDISVKGVPENLIRKAVFEDEKEEAAARKIEQDSLLQTKTAVTKYQSGLDSARIVDNIGGARDLLNTVKNQLKKPVMKPYLPKVKEVLNEHMKSPLVPEKLALPQLDVLHSLHSLLRPRRGDTVPKHNDGDQSDGKDECVLAKRFEKGQLDMNYVVNIEFPNIMKYQLHPEVLASMVPTLSWSSARGVCEYAEREPSPCENHNKSAQACEAEGKPADKYAHCAFVKEGQNAWCEERKVPDCEERMTENHCEGLPWPEPINSRGRRRCEWNYKSKYSAICEDADILPCDIRNSQEQCDRTDLLMSSGDMCSWSAPKGCVRVDESNEEAIRKIRTQRSIKKEQASKKQRTMRRANAANVLLEMNTSSDMEARRQAAIAQEAAQNKKLMDMKVHPSWLAPLSDTNTWCVENVAAQGLLEPSLGLEWSLLAPPDAREGDKFYTPAAPSAWPNFIVTWGCTPTTSYGMYHNHHTNWLLFPLQCLTCGVRRLFVKIVEFLEKRPQHSDKAGGVESLLQVATETHGKEHVEKALTSLLRSEATEGFKRMHNLYKTVHQRGVGSTGQSVLENCFKDVFTDKNEGLGVYPAKVAKGRELMPMFLNLEWPNLIKYFHRKREGMELDPDEDIKRKQLEAADFLPEVLLLINPGIMPNDLKARCDILRRIGGAYDDFQAMVESLENAGKKGAEAPRHSGDDIFADSDDDDGDDYDYDYD